MVNRKQIDEIIMKNDTNDWWQPHLFTQYTKHLLPQELEILSDPPAEDKNYNCFIYALNLHRDFEILKETNGFIFESFIKQLLASGDLVKTDSPHDGDYIVYQDLVNYPDSLTHIGVLNGNKVVSKWAWGPIVKHDLWDVPAEYGDYVFYMQSISTQQASDLYHKYKSFNVKPV